jgi:undecaprenyl-diphosphatase
MAALLVGVSRLYIGTHYLSDIVGGAVAAAVTIVTLLYKKESRLNRFW